MVYLYLLWISVIISPAMDESRQTSNDNKVHWNVDRKLSWEDFKGSPKPTSQYSAESSLQIAYGLKISEESGITSYSFTVDCYFEKNDSWVKAEKKTETLLKHEQLHFDIAEYFARKLRREFRENSFTIQDYQSKSTAIFNKNFAEYQGYQTAYDADTRHGSIAEEQIKWEERIQGLLTKSDAYKKM